MSGGEVKLRLSYYGFPVNKLYLGIICNISLICLNGFLTDLPLALDT